MKIFICQSVSFSSVPHSPSCLFTVSMIFPVSACPSLTVSELYLPVRKLQLPSFLRLSVTHCIWSVSAYHNSRFQAISVRPSLTVSKLPLPAHQSLFPTYLPVRHSLFPSCFCLIITSSKLLCLFITHSLQAVSVFLSLTISNCLYLIITTSKLLCFFITHYFPAVSAFLSLTVSKLSLPVSACLSISISKLTLCLSLPQLGHYPTFPSILCLSITIVWQMSLSCPSPTLSKLFMPARHSQFRSCFFLSITHNFQAVSSCPSLTILKLSLPDQHPVFPSCLYLSIIIVC